MQTTQSSQELSHEEIILRCAEQEFIEKGYAGARLASIAEAAGVSKSALHYYFRSKDKLFENIINQKLTTLSEALLPALYDVDRSFVIYIKNIIGKHLRFIADNPLLPGFILRELSAPTPQAQVILTAIRNLSSTVIKVFSEKIEQAVAEGLCCAVDPKMLLIDIISLNAFPYIASPVLNALFDDCMADREQFMEQRRLETLALISRRLKPVN